VVNLFSSFALVPLSAAMLLATPWLLHGVTEADRLLVRGLLGPGTPAERVRTLEESRARAVDDSAARLTDSLSDAQRSGRFRGFYLMGVPGRGSTC
jgi:hypothetical protein